MFGSSNSGESRPVFALRAHLSRAACIFRAPRVRCVKIGLSRPVRSQEPCILYMQNIAYAHALSSLCTCA